MAKTIIGTVSSDKVDKTIVVTVHSRKTHPLYRKQYTMSKKFMAHDAKNEAKVGDRVEIVETRPLSARKRHMLIRIVETAAITHVEPEPVVEKTDEPTKPATGEKK
jgi:small subunit ribosomal protein S17